MKKLLYYFLFILLIAGCNATTNVENRNTILLDKNWQFINQEIKNAEMPETKTSDWETISIPHDWAISGEFDKTIDEQEVMVIEDGEKVAKLRTGRTGGLPHIGVGWYRKELNITPNMKGKRINIEFDGAMSNAKVYLNGHFVGEWPYGYNSFGFDLTEYINFKSKNILAVRLENKPQSARWYPGAGLYRNVRLVITNPVYVKMWGTYVTTPDIKEGKGTVNLKISILNKSGKKKSVAVINRIITPDSTIVEEVATNIEIEKTIELEQVLTVKQPKLWSVNTPNLYTIITDIIEGGDVVDSYKTSFGFRYIEFTNNDGFYLNGERTQLKGVCLHHDLGPLGAAANKSALVHRMKLLQEMGCNSIRTSHNPPTPELLDLADEMGFLVIDEAFDEWKEGKNENGYGKLWDKWAEKDLVAMIHRDRNHPSIILWSIGNEIREQKRSNGGEMTKFLVKICHREDSTRLTTAGFNHWKDAIKNGLAEAVDVPGWNYKPHKYEDIHKDFPNWKMYGSETASTVSTRGEYFFPAVERKHYTREPYHCSSFDNEFPSWACSPDKEFAAQDDHQFMAGEYVWTGFDYLGEPTPYNVEWPSRSSYFGIIDLCGIPKDRYFLYQSKWTKKEVLHLLPHWNWEEGQNVSVHCYTNFNKAELFLNGKSLGVRQKDSSKQYTRYRLIWDDLNFEPGELKVVALDADNNALAENKIQTADAPAGIKLEADRTEILANGKELVYVTVSIVDKNGIVCPKASNLVKFTVEGKGSFKAVGNGDPTSLESFVKPFRKAFNGKCMAIIQSSETPGEIKLKAESDNLETKTLTISTKSE